MKSCRELFVAAEGAEQNQVVSLKPASDGLQTERRKDFKNLGVMELERGDRDRYLLLLFSGRN